MCGGLRHPKRRGQHARLGPPLCWRGDPRRHGPLGCCSRHPGVPRGSQGQPGRRHTDVRPCACRWSCRKRQGHIAGLCAPRRGPTAVGLDPCPGRGCTDLWPHACSWGLLLGACLHQCQPRGPLAGLWVFLGGQAAEVSGHGHNDGLDTSVGELNPGSCVRVQSASCSLLHPPLKICFTLQCRTRTEAHVQRGFLRVDLTFP